jgi:regulator of CtrA degradation
MANERDQATMEISSAGNGGRTDAVSFTHRLLASENFMLLFREGMSLVEATAAYLDGEGRADSRFLERPVALAYASESMRLTTRLMQLTSWLLLQRAVNEGELSREEAEREHRRVVIAPPESRTDDAIFGALPESLRSLIQRSNSLHARIQRFDRDLKSEPEPASTDNPVASQLGMLAAAFQRR